MKFYQRDNVKNVLIYRLGSLGDTVIALPSFRLVRETFPSSEVTLLTNVPVDVKAPRSASVLEGTGLIDGYLEYPVSLRDPLALKTLRDRIAARGFDLLVYLARPRGGRLLSMRDSLFFHACGVHRQIGVPYKRSDLYCLPVPGTDLYRPESHRLVGNLRALGRPDLTEDRWWDLGLTDFEREQANQLLEPIGADGPILALCAGTKMPVKDWTEPNWARLIEELGEDYSGHALVAVGAPEERECSDRILGRWPGVTLNLCGASSPRVSAAVLERASLFLGQDSGPMHLAACVGTPCVAIFSSRNLPGQWYPRGADSTVLYTTVPCFGCDLLECLEHQKKCILSITVEAVHAAAVAKLGRGSAATATGGPRR